MKRITVVISAIASWHSRLLILGEYINFNGSEQSNENKTSDLIWVKVLFVRKKINIGLMECIMLVQNPFCLLQAAAPSCGD